MIVGRVGHRPFIKPMLSRGPRAYFQKKRSIYSRKNREPPRGVLLLLASRLDGLHTSARPKSAILGNSSLVYAVCILLMSLKTFIILVDRPGASWDLRARRALVAVRPPGGLFGPRGLFFRRAADFRESLVSCTRAAYFRPPRGLAEAPFRSFSLPRIGA